MTYSQEDLALLAALKAIEDARENGDTVKMPGALLHDMLDREWLTITGVAMTRLGSRELELYRRRSTSKRGSRR